MFLLLLKSRVRGHWRKLKSGKRVWVREYQTKRQRKLPEAGGKRMVFFRRGEYELPIKAAEEEVQYRGFVPLQEVWENEAQHGYTEIDRSGRIPLLYYSIREALQNSIDACRAAMREGKIQRGRIDITIDREAAYVAIKDNGIGMDRETLATKFLAVRGSGKRGMTGVIGGFGFAKSVIFGAVSSALGGTWRVRTNELEVTMEDLQSGEKFSDIAARPIRGTIIELFGRRDKPQSIRGLEDYMEVQRHLVHLLKHCPLTDIDIYFNGRKITRDFSFEELEREKGIVKREQTKNGTRMRIFARRLRSTTISPRADGRKIICCNGMAYVISPLYSFPYDLFIDIETEQPATLANGEPNPYYPFNTRRNGLVYPFDADIDWFVRELTVDPYSTAKKVAPNTKRKRLNADVHKRLGAIIRDAMEQYVRDAYAETNLRMLMTELGHHIHSMLYTGIDSLDDDWQIRRLYGDDIYAIADIIAQYCEPVYYGELLPTSENIENDLLASMRRHNFPTFMPRATEELRERVEKIIRGHIKDFQKWLRGHSAKHSLESIRDEFEARKPDMLRDIDEAIAALAKKWRGAKLDAKAKETVIKNCHLQNSLIFKYWQKKATQTIEVEYDESDRNALKRMQELFKQPHRQLAAMLLWALGDFVVQRLYHGLLERDTGILFTNKALATNKRNGREKINFNAEDILEAIAQSKSVKNVIDLVVFLTTHEIAHSTAKQHNEEFTVEQCNIMQRVVKRLNHADYRLMERLAGYLLRAYGRYAVQEL